MEKENNTTLIPASIVLAGLLIAGGIFLSRTPLPNTQKVDDQKVPVEQTGDLSKARDVSASDSYRGDLNAPVKVIEYSDLECPFCKRHHQNLKQIFEIYGKTGQIVWVYRQTPLIQLHQKAQTEALAAECVKAQKGNEGFWKIIDKIYEITPSNDGLDLSILPQLAKDAGAIEKDFMQCMKDGKLLENIKLDSAEFSATGGKGTPWTIVIGKDGKRYSINGAQPVENIKAIIEQALK